MQMGGQLQCDFAKVFQPKIKNHINFINQDNTHRIQITPAQASQPTLIGSLFGILNGILAAVAFFWFFAVTLKGLVKAGHQAQVFNGGRSAIHPIMTFVGFMMLVPTKSGWSLSQLIMLWATSTMGIGSANQLTDKAMDMMNSGYSMVTQPTAPSTRSAARGVSK